MNSDERPAPVRDKERTKRKLIDAVGEIIRTEGHSGLGVNKVAKLAGVSKKLIYNYFGRDFNNLIEAFVMETDHWMAFSANVREWVSKNADTPEQQLMTDLLQNHFRYFYLNRQMQNLILWEVSEDSPLMRSIHNARESMGQQLFELTDRHFSGTGVNFRAVAALLVGGIYYCILHTRHNGGMVCDIDITTENGRAEMLRSIRQIVDWAYREAEPTIEK